MKPEACTQAIPPRFGDEGLPAIDLGDRIFAAVRAAPARRTPIVRRLAIAVGLLPLLATLPLLVRHAISGRSVLRVDLGELPREQLAIELALVCLVTLGVTLVALRPGRMGLGSTVTALGGATFAVLPAHVVAEVVWPLRSLSVHAREAVAHLHPWGAPCVLIAATTGLLVLGTLVWALRGASPAAAHQRGAVLGATSGAWAALALFVHCPGCAIEHVGASHLLPIAVFTVIGALAAPRWLRP